MVVSLQAAEAEQRKVFFTIVDTTSADPGPTLDSVLPTLATIPEAIGTDPVFQV